MQPDTAGVRFGPFWLAPGVRRLHAATFFVSSFTFVTLVTFLNFVQPYLLNNVLGVPAGQQGTVTGLLNLVQEGTALVVMGFVGALSDRTGRRSLCVLGLLIWALGFVLFPMATSVPQLYFFRFIVALGVATASVMVITTMQDCPQEISRGKWGGVNSLITSFAILLVSLVLARVPGWLEARGYAPVSAGRLTFWFGAGAALVAAAIVRVGWHPGRIAGAAAAASPLTGLRAGLSAAVGNPRLALAYCAGFAARGDLVVVGAFFSLWFVRAGADQGVAAGDALARGGMTLSALLLANWIWAPAFGWLIDRMDRVRALAMAMALAALGYVGISLVADPFNAWVAVPATFLLGIGEISAVIAGNALVGQEAPATIRGAAIGVFSLVGTLGILTATVVGGLVFDGVAYTAPFAMMGVVNAMVAALALVVFLRAGAARL